MPSPSSIDGPLVLIHGDDDFAVRKRSKEIYDGWCTASGGFDNEIIDARVTNSGDALDRIARLREALQTLPFFGSAKIVWFQSCSFLGDDRTSKSSAVTEALQSLAEDFKKFNWAGVRLLMSSSKADKRKSIYKALEKLGKVELLASWSSDDRNWPSEAAATAKRLLQAARKEIGSEALDLLIAGVGPNPALLASEVEKLIVFTGERKAIAPDDVETITVRNKQSRAFAVGDAFGERNLPKFLRALDEEFWSMRNTSQKSEIGLLYGLISKVRAMILIKEMLHEGWIRPDGDYSRFQSQLQRIPVDRLPQDPKYNPLSLNPYVLFKTVQHAARYSREELSSAMAALLDCNRKLVSSAIDESLAIQQTLVGVMAAP